MVKSVLSRTCGPCSWTDPTSSSRAAAVILRKQSVRSQHLETDNDGDRLVRWAMLLRHRGQDGQLYRATSIDLRVGCTMDGAIVYYDDGKHENCGPVRDKRTGKPHQFGGHASERHYLPANEIITKIKICRVDSGWASLAGIRMTLSNGDEWGYLNHDDNSNSSDGEEEDESVVTLEPGEGKVVVGFYGQSDSGCGYTHEFGILTAPEGVELPEKIYDLPELRNV